MYVVRSGEGIISAGTVLEVVGPGETFGELSLVDGEPRGVTAIARTATEVAVIDERAFRYLVTRDPGFALDLSRCLSHRLRQMIGDRDRR